MSEKKKTFVVLQFDSRELAQAEGRGIILGSDEYPTKRHNGWTNYETWAVALWIDSERGTYEYWREAVQEVWNEATAGEYSWQTREQQAVYALAKQLEDEHEEQAQERTGEASVFTDLLNAALSEVNWSEIAEHMIEECEKTEEDP